MFQHKVESLCRLADAWNSRDVETFVARCDPRVEIHPAIAELGAAHYHGHAGVRDWFRDMEDACGGTFRIEPEAFFAMGERTLAFHTRHGRGQRSGAEVAMPSAGVIGWRDDLVVYYKTYVHRPDALSDLGVSENELEPIEP